MSIRISLRMVVPFPWAGNVHLDSGAGSWFCPWALLSGADGDRDRGRTNKGYCSCYSEVDVNRSFEELWQYHPRIARFFRPIQFLETTMDLVITTESGGTKVNFKTWRNWRTDLPSYAMPDSNLYDGNDLVAWLPPKLLSMMWWRASSMISIRNIVSMWMIVQSRYESKSS